MGITNSRLGTVVAGATVLVTLGGLGGAVASSLVTSADIQDGTIRTVDLHSSAVNSRKIEDGTIRKSDLAFPVPNAPVAQAITVTKSGINGAAVTFGNELNCPRGTTLLGQSVGDGTSTEPVTARVLLGQPTVTSYDVTTWPGSTALKGVDNVVVDSDYTGDYVAVIRIMCG